MNRRHLVLHLPDLPLPNPTLFRSIPGRRNPAGESYLSETGANASWRSGETPAPHAPDGYERGHGHPPAYPMYRWPPSRAPTPALPPPRGADAVRRSAPNLPAFSCVVHRTERQRARPLAAHSLPSVRIPLRNAEDRKDVV